MSSLMNSFSADRKTLYYYLDGYEAALGVFMTHSRFSRAVNDHVLSSDSLETIESSKTGSLSTCKRKV